MADDLMMQYTLDYEMEPGKPPVRVVLHAPKGTSEDDLKAAAHEYLIVNAPHKDFPEAVVADPAAKPPEPAALEAANEAAGLEAATARADATTAKLGPNAGRTKGTGLIGFDDLMSRWGEFGLGALQGPYNAAAFVTDPLLRPFVGGDAVEDVRAQRANLVHGAEQSLIPYPHPGARELGQIVGTAPAAALRAPAAVEAMLPRLAPIVTRGVQGALMGAGVREQDADAGGLAAEGALANIVLPPVAGATARAVANSRPANYIASKAPAAARRAGDVLGRIYDAIAPAVGAGREVPAVLTKPQEAYQLSRKYGVDMMPADVGGTLIKGASAGTAQTLAGAPLVIGGAKKTQTQLGEAVGRVADDTGLVLEEVDAGNLAKQGAEAVIKQTSARGEQLYSRVKDVIGDAPIVPLNTVRALDQQIAEVSKSHDPTDPVLKQLLKLREQVAGDDVPDGLTYDGMRRVTSLTKKLHLNEDLRNTDAERRLKNITKAMDDDVRATLDATQPGLGAQYDRANAFWRDRVDTIDKVFEPLVGKNVSGESVVTKLNQMFQGKGHGGAMLAGRLLDELPLADARNLRATVIANLGKAKPNAQDETNSVFSSETFLTNWNKVTMRGRKFLTNRDPELGKSLNELATLAARVRESNALANKSHTGRAVRVGEFLSSAAASVGAAAQGAGSFSAIAGPALIAGIEGLTGAALSSPKMVKLLVRAGSLRTPGAAENWARQMASLAARSPELRDDIEHVMKAVMPGSSDEPATGTSVPLAGEPANPYADLDEDALRALAGEVAPQSGSGGETTGGSAALPLDNPNLLPETVELAPGVLNRESGGDPDAVSPAGAQGLMQVMPATGRDPGYGIKPLQDDSPQENARFGVDYLDAMLRKHNAHKVLGLMAYNWGPGEVDQWLKSGRRVADVPLETRKYVNAILKDDVFPVER